MILENGKRVGTGPRVQQLQRVPAPRLILPIPGVRFIPDKPIPPGTVLPYPIELPPNGIGIYDPNDPKWVVPVEPIPRGSVEAPHPAFVGAPMFQYDYNPISQQVTIGFNGPRADFEYLSTMYDGKIEEDGQGWTFIKGDIRLLAGGLAAGGATGVDLGEGVGSVEIITVIYRSYETGLYLPVQFVAGRVMGSNVFFPVQNQP